jgi:tyramine---L-glutamate ligase
MFSIPTVFIYEYFTGGGCPEGELPNGLAAEALGMLWALLADFHAWGAVHTITAFDPRFEAKIAGLNHMTLPADEVVCVSPTNHKDVYLSLLKRCDATLIVAPETDGILAMLIAKAERIGIPLLGSSAAAAARAGNKALCSRLFRSANLPTPKTRCTTFLNAPQESKQMGFPLVMKPIDGVGSEGIYRLNSFLELSTALDSVRRVTRHNRILLQSLISGIHASVSLLTAKGQCIPLSLNCQLMDAESSFQYLGSQVPFDHRAKDHAMDLACSAVKLIPGLKGYVGVDLVLSDDSAQLIEINPRLTTSYIGLRQVAQVNLAKAIWDTCRKGTFPESIPLKGQVVIRKDDPDSWALQTDEHMTL